MGAVAKSYMRKGFLIYEEMRKYFVIIYIRRPLVIYDFATAPLLDFLIDEENFVFFFYQCTPIYICLDEWGLLKLKVS
jgi:hypothetical protein